MSEHTVMTMVMKTWFNFHIDLVDNNDLWIIVAYLFWYKETLVDKVDIAAIGHISCTQWAKHCNPSLYISNEGYSVLIDNDFSN